MPAAAVAGRPAVAGQDPGGPFAGGLGSPARRARKHAAAIALAGFARATVAQESIRPRRRQAATVATWR